MGYQLIEHIEVGSGGTSSLVVSDIPQTGQDLLILNSLRSSKAVGRCFITYNNDGSNQNYLYLTGNGSTSSSSSGTASSENDLAAYSDATANTFSSSSVYISGYASSANKSISTDSVTENNGTFAEARITAANYNSSSPITTFSISIAASSLIVEGSTCSIYMITAD
tara:strand:+ start:257 stop:757 length:501 start_codon:yes stop_codon:yes gene_type:complete